MAERSIRRAVPEKNPPQVRTGWRAAINLWAEQAEQIYFLYQKIASATKATVMIHRTMSLLRFFSFSSAIAESTPYLKARFKCCLDFLAKYESLRLGWAAGRGKPFVSSELH